MTTRPFRGAAALLVLAAVGGADPIRVWPVNPRYFERDGKPIVLVTSDHHYGAVIDADSRSRSSTVCTPTAGR